MDSLKKIKKETSGPDHSLDFNSIRDPFHPEITSPAPISPLHISLERRDSYDVISNIPITKECLEAVNNIGLIPLQYAILFDLDQKIVLYLAFQSQFFQVRDSHGNTPLHMLMLMNIKDDNDNDRFNLMKQLQTSMLLVAILMVLKLYGYLPKNVLIFHHWKGIKCVEMIKLIIKILFWDQILIN
jgi:ankyrin repeat protein